MRSAAVCPAHYTHTLTHTHRQMQMGHPHTRTCCNVANSRCKSLRLASKNVATLPKCFRFRLRSRFRCCKPPNSAGGRALSLPPGGSCSSMQSPHVALVCTQDQQQKSENRNDENILCLFVYVYVASDTRCGKWQSQFKRARRHLKTVNRWRQ